MWKTERTIRFEYVGQRNPIPLNFSQTGAIDVKAIEVETFYYDSAGVGPKFLGLAINGVRGRYDETMLEIPVVITFPRRNNIFYYEDTASDINKELDTSVGIGTSLEIGFVSRDSANRNVPMVFAQDYLLQITFIVVDS